MNTIEYQRMYRLEDHHWWFVAKRNFVAQMLRDVRVPANILDIGCGTGAMEVLLRAYGSVEGIDVSPKALSYAKKRKLNVKKGSANSLPFHDGRFDLVTFFDVLYHKGVNEQVALREAFRVLKPGGKIIITDCAMPFLWSVHDEHMDAKKRYTLREMEGLVRQAGFTLQKFSYIYASTFLLFCLSRIFVRLFQSESTVNKVPHIINTILITILWTESKALRFVSYPFGSSLLMVAYKPK